MTAQATQTLTHPTLSATVARLFVSDIKASCDFFTRSGVLVLYGAVRGKGRSRDQLTMD
jgi:hypothetical protein